MQGRVSQNFDLGPKFFSGNLEIHIQIIDEKLHVF